MDARDIDLRLEWACEALGLDVPGVIWESSHHPDKAENGSDAPAWVNLGEWDIHMHRDSAAYVGNEAAAEIEHLCVRHTAWHELGHLFAERLWGAGINRGLLAELTGYRARNGLSLEETLAESVAQVLIITAGEHMTWRYDVDVRKELGLMDQVGEAIWVSRMAALDGRDPDAARLALARPVTPPRRRASRRSRTATRSRGRRGLSSFRSGTPSRRSWRQPSFDRS